MTAWILALAAIGLVVVLGVLSYHLIKTLRQVRMTARAAEQLLMVTRPRIDETLQEVNLILARANRLVLQAELSDGGKAASVTRGVSHAVAYAKAAIQAVKMVKALREDIQDALSWTRTARQTDTDHRTTEEPREVRYATGGSS